MRLLIIEDEYSLVDAMSESLKRENYLVDICYEGNSGLDMALSGIHDIIILDLMLPNLNGLEILKSIREEKISSYVIILTAKGELDDKVIGLDRGADDYMTKPFNPLELSVRVKALLRRTYYFNNMNTNKDIINIENLTIDKNERTVKVDDVEIPFTSREFDILYLLGSNRGRVFSSEEIFTKVWKEDYFGSNNTVMVHMSRIREKLDKYIAGNKIIKTVWGVGYKIEK